MVLRILMILTLMGSTFFCNAQFSSFEKISMDMETKTAKDGYSSYIKASIYYGNDGKMISYYKYPKEYVILNNSKGEIKIYDQAKNTVLQQQNYMYSTETSQFYYFLNNKKSDLGLGEMGFTQSNVKFEEGLMITEWLPPAQMSKDLSKVELVHENGQPIYIAYYDQNNFISTKAYYYNYTSLNSILSFPATITQIKYVTPTDSTITKITYDNFLVDKNVESSLLNFKIPNNAKSVN